MSASESFCSQLCRWKFLTLTVSATGTFYGSYAGDNICCIYAGFKVVISVIGMLVDISVTIMQVTVSVAIMQLVFLQCIMHMTVSIVIIQVNSYAGDSFK